MKINGITKTSVVAGVLCAWASLWSCGGEPLPEEPVPSAQAALGGKADTLDEAPPTLVFHKDFEEWATAPLVAGGPVAIDYDEARLPECRASHNGNPGWQISAFMFFLPSGDVSEVELFAHGLKESGEVDVFSWVKQKPVLVIPHGTTEVQVWFRNTSGFDHPCVKWDSDFGKNYRFEVVQPEPEPIISLGADWSVTQEGELKKGKSFIVRYEPERMERVAKGNDYFGYFASKYHCYGYGCCSHTYDNTLHVRFDPSSAFTDIPLDSAEVAVTIPQEASAVELYVSSVVMTETWYCGGTEGPHSTQGPDYFYDSNFGQNFLFWVF